jgi:cell division protein FtsL
MIRLSIVVWIMVVACSAFGLYSVKFKVQTLRTQIAEASQQLERERESMNVVAAEWAYLNRPDRIQKLAATYLNTKEVTVQQVAEIAAIPFPQVQEAKADTGYSDASTFSASLQVHE